MKSLRVILLLAAIFAACACLAHAEQGSTNEQYGNLDHPVDSQGGGGHHHDNDDDDDGDEGHEGDMPPGKEGGHHGGHHGDHEGGHHGGHHGDHEGDEEHPPHHGDPEDGEEGFYGKEHSEHGEHHRPHQDDSHEVENMVFVGVGVALLAAIIAGVVYKIRSRRASNRRPPQQMTSVLASAPHSGSLVSAPTAGNTPAFDTSHAVRAAGASVNPPVQARKEAAPMPDPIPSELPAYPAAGTPTANYSEQPQPIWQAAAASPTVNAAQDGLHVPLLPNRGSAAGADQVHSPRR